VARNRVQAIERGSHVDRRTVQEHTHPCTRAAYTLGGMPGRLARLCG
jgi:hypothetical protein